MKKQCDATVKDGQCKKVAEFVVEKNDLSHRKISYCADHAEPYKQYPRDFSITPLTN